MMYGGHKRPEMMSGVNKCEEEIAKHKPKCEENSTHHSEVDIANDFDIGEGCHRRLEPIPTHLVCLQGLLNHF